MLSFTPCCKEESVHWYQGVALGLENKNYVAVIRELVVVYTMHRHLLDALATWVSVDKEPLCLTVAKLKLTL